MTGFPPQPVRQTKHTDRYENPLSSRKPATGDLQKHTNIAYFTHTLLEKTHAFIKNKLLTINTCWVTIYYFLAIEAFNFSVSISNTWQYTKGLWGLH